MSNYEYNKLIDRLNYYADKLDELTVNEKEEFNRLCELWEDEETARENHQEYCNCVGCD